MQHFCFLIIGICLFSCKQQAILPTASIPEQIVLDTIIAQAINESTDMRIRETSGLMEIDGALWTHNDSGGATILYQLDKLGNIIKEVTLDVPGNVDWESLAVDEDYFYVGDFGNNLGKRKNLRIFKGLKSELHSDQPVSAETITFQYEDQSTFYNGYNHNFDGEALISFRDHLYIFSKNWLDKKCKVYKLPKTKGDHIAVKVDQYDTKGLITGADISDDQQEIALIGYGHDLVTREFLPFYIKLNQWKEDKFFSGDIQQTPLSIQRQTESISFHNSGEIWITSETKRPGNPTIFKLLLE